MAAKPNKEIYKIFVSKEVSMVGVQCYEKLYKIGRSEKSQFGAFVPALRLRPPCNVFLFFLQALSISKVLATICNHNCYHITFCRKTII